MSFVLVGDGVGSFNNSLDLEQINFSLILCNVGRMTASSLSDYRQRFRIKWLGVLPGPHQLVGFFCV